MDVPISLAVILAGGMSLSETIQSGPHAYFDSAVTLLFFLLLGRYLDRRARGKARSAAERLLALRSGAVTVLEADGSRRVLPADQLQPGMRILAAAGERIAADGRIVEGTSELDSSLLTGETLPHAAQPGTRVYSGTLNLSAPVTVEVTAVGENTLLSEIVAPDGDGRAAPGEVRRARRPDGARLRARRAPAGAGGLPGLGGRWAAWPGSRRCLIAVAVSDRDLPVRARPRGAGGAGDRERAALEARRAAQVRHRAGAAGPGRHGGVRQDRHAHARAGRS
ncbi:MAG: hypothetical protein U5L06_05560 [Rhodovibrio sp.]|nr:hypothetical protein [Rhodovibrio sp.]